MLRHKCYRLGGFVLAAAVLTACDTSPPNRAMLSIRRSRSSTACCRVRGCECRWRPDAAPDLVHELARLGQRPEPLPREAAYSRSASWLRPRLDNSSTTRCCASSSR